MAEELVRYEQRGEVALIQVDDGKVNAIAHSLLDPINAALDRAQVSACYLRTCLAHLCPTRIKVRSLSTCNCLTALRSSARKRSPGRLTRSFLTIPTSITW